MRNDYKNKEPKGDIYDGTGMTVINFADAIKEEDSIIEGYKKGVEEYRAVTFKGGKEKHFYLSPLSGDFGIFEKIVKIANGSFTVDAVADDKKLMIAGNPLIFKRGKNRKFSFRKQSKLLELSDAELDIIEDRLADMGDVGNIQDIGECVIEDLIKAGNCFIQVRRVKNSEGKYKLYFSIIPVQNCRLKMRSYLNANGKSYEVDTTEAFKVGVCSNWAGMNKVMNRDLVWDIPLLGKGENVEDDWQEVKVGEMVYEVTCIHLKFRKTGFKHYGMPRWIPSYWYACFENLFGRVNVTKVKNNSMASGVLQLFAKPSITPAKAKQLKEEVQDRYNSLDSVGSIMVQVLTDKELAANFVNFGKEGSKEGDYIEFLKICSKALITSMRTFPDLAGIAVAGELGGTDKVKSNFVITQNRDINPNQNFIIEKVYLPIFNLLETNEGDGMFKDLNCEYSNSMPTLLFGDIVLSDILDRDELRAELGYPAQGKEYVKNPIDNNPINKP